MRYWKWYQHSAIFLDASTLAKIYTHMLYIYSSQYCVVGKCNKFIHSFMNSFFIPKYCSLLILLLQMNWAVIYNTCTKFLLIETPLFGPKYVLALKSFKSIF